MSNTENVDTRPELRLAPAYDGTLPEDPRPIVVLGAGGIVRDAHLPAYRKANFPVFGIANRTRARAEALAEQFDIERTFGSVQEAVDAAPSDAIFDLALMPEQYLDALSALPSGAPVLIQKPLGNDLSSGLEVLELCRRKGLVAAVNTQLRFAPYVTEARKLIAAGAIGELIDLEIRVSTETDWSRFPGVLGLDRLEINMHSVHYIDLVRSFLGTPDAVSAVTVRHPDRSYANSRSEILMRYRDRPLRVVISTNHEHAFGGKYQESFIKWEGTRGAIRAQMGLMLNYPLGGPDELEIVTTSDRDWRPVPFTGSWFPDAFIGSMGTLQRYVEGSVSELPTSVEDVILTMETVEAAYESAETEGVRVRRFRSR